jgi:hypothetical protein
MLLVIRLEPPAILARAASCSERRGARFNWGKRKRAFIVPLLQRNFVHVAQLLLSTCTLGSHYLSPSAVASNIITIRHRLPPHELRTPRIEQQQQPCLTQQYQIMRLTK